MASAHRLGIASLHDAYKTRLIDPETVLETLLDDIASDSNDINAFCYLDADGARSQAKASSERWRQGMPLGPLDGVPVSIKDLTDVAGWPTRWGSRSTMDDPAPALDAPVVQHLRNAGAVIFGKTATTEFGWSISSENPHTGVTRNPLDLQRTPGGSSCGAAAQIAAGWGALAIGSDAGGSVRIPASYCGLVGFKPTHSAVPMALSSAFSDIAHLGTLTRNVDDCALAMKVLSQPDPRDQGSLYSRIQHVSHRGTRLLWTNQSNAQMTLQPEVGQAFADLLNKLSDDGYELVNVDATSEGCAQAMWFLWASRVYEAFLGWPENRRNKLGELLQSVYEQGARLTTQQVAWARGKVRESAVQLSRHFATADFMLTPTTPTSAPTLADVAGGAVASAPATAQNWFEQCGFAYLFNVTQQPALSLPLGGDGSGMPFGLQVIGRKFSDAEVLRFSRWIEQRLR